MVSIVIPTLWKAKRQLLDLLEIYERSEQVEEIILIDNDPGNNLFDLSSIKKLVYVPQRTNLFVNPSWNLGASLARADVVLSNDDIEIDRFDELAKMVQESDYDIVGASYSDKNIGLNISTVDRFPAKGYGCLMFIRNYKDIPANLVILYGDQLLFDRAKNRGVFSGIRFSNISASCRKFNRHIKALDAVVYRKEYQTC